MKIYTSSYTNKGGRIKNEDSCDFSYDGVNGVWVVADGLGGLPYGDIASKLVTKWILNESFSLDITNNQEIIKVINSSNELLKQKQIDFKARNGLRTTLTAAFCSKRILKFIHVGDSRFYYFRDNNICYQSKDHSMSQIAATLGEINQSDIRFHEDRNIVTKALGNIQSLNLSIDFETEIICGDAFMLCTDGFWELIYEDEMVDDLKNSNDTKTWLGKMLKRHFKRLNNKSDNYTVICCMVSKE